jgi:hypothetical protein
MLIVLIPSISNEVVLTRDECIDRQSADKEATLFSSLDMEPANKKRRHISSPRKRLIFGGRESIDSNGVAMNYGSLTDLGFIARKYQRVKLKNVIDSSNIKVQNSPFTLKYASPVTMSVFDEVHRRTDGNYIQPNEFDHFDQTVHEDHGHHRLKDHTKLRNNGGSHIGTLCKVISDSTISRFHGDKVSKPRSGMRLIDTELVTFFGGGKGQHGQCSAALPDDIHTMPSEYKLIPNSRSTTPSLSMQELKSQTLDTVEYHHL